MLEPDFNLGNRIKLVPGRKDTDKEMIQFDGKIILPSEISKIVMLFLLIEDKKWPPPRYKGGNMFKDYLVGMMNSRKYQDPPKGALSFSPYQDKLD